MPRTKGNKNRSKTDIVSQIIENQIQIATRTTEIEATQKDIDEKKTEDEAMVKKLLVGGMSADEIFEKLK